MAVGQVDAKKLGAKQVEHYLLNQVRASLWPARTWFLKIDPVWIVGMRVRVCACVCPHPRLLITSGMMWHDVNLIGLA